MLATTAAELEGVRSASTARPILLMAAALFAWLALLAFLIPFDSDEAVYKSIAAGIVDGRWPYRDLFDHKPPLIYAWYLPAGLGVSLPLQRLIAAGAVVASVPVLHTFAARHLAARQATFSTALYCLFLANPFLRMTANNEAFMLLPIVGAATVRSPFLSGALLGVAVMTKSSGLAFLPLILWIHHRDAVGCLAGLVVVCALVSLPFAPIWRDYMDANLGFNVDYSRYRSVDERLTNLLTFNRQVFLGAIPLWLLAAAGLLMRRNSVIFLWAVCGYAATKATAWDFAHYYVLLVPPAALLAAIALDYAWRSRIFIVVATLLALRTVGGNAADLVSMSTLPSNPLHSAEVYDVAAASTGEFYVLGDGAFSYAYAGKQPQRRIFYAAPLVVREEWGMRERAALEACPPNTLLPTPDKVFDVPWADEVRALYRDIDEFEEGTLLRDPYKPCDRAR